MCSLRPLRAKSAPILQVQVGAGDEIAHRARHQDLARHRRARRCGTRYARRCRRYRRPSSRSRRYGRRSGHRRLNARRASMMAPAQRTARAGPSKVARNPSPSVLISRPRKRPISPRTILSCWSRSARQRAIAHLLGAAGGIDDVREQDRGQHPVGLALGVRAGEELLDLVGDGPASLAHRT